MGYKIELYSETLAGMGLDPLPNYIPTAGANVAKKVRDNYRFDQEIVDHLESKNLSYVDMMKAHVKDLAKHNLPVEDYLKIYYIGHYNPRGVFFYAFNLKDKLVELLNPKPIPYRD